MTFSYSQTLCQDMPDFSTATPQGRWDKINYKLTVFHEQGGQFRDETVMDFQKNQGYPANVKGWQENCFSTALGLFVSGDQRLEPGSLHLLKRNKKTNMLHVTNDGSLPHYPAVKHDAERYEQLMQAGLEQDGIGNDIKLTDIATKMPVIGLSYHYDKEQMDYHWLVPHLKNTNLDGDLLFSISHRAEFQGVLAEYKDEKKFIASRFLNADCHAADVYFVDRSWLGQRVHVDKPGFDKIPVKSSKPQRMRWS